MTKSVNRKIITDNLIIEKTGKSMEDWFKILDEKGAREMKHIEIYNLINSIEGWRLLGQWNQNLLTTTYEWNRKLKERGQREDGFEISVSRTISVPVQILYNAWSDKKLRSRWLSQNEIEIRKATENKSLVITWHDNTTVRVELYSKGENKSQVVVQHMKIPEFKIAESMKVFWGEALSALKTFLER